MTSRLADIRDKVDAGERLSFDDGLFLDEQADLFTLGELANLVRERKNGNVAYYNVNTHLNPTNVCVYRCTFCAFRADLKSPKGYVMIGRADPRPRRRGRRARRDRAAHRRRAAPPAAVRVVPERRPHHPRARIPRLHLKAYTAVEWDWFARLTGRPTQGHPRRVEGRRPGQPARRRGGDLPSRSPRQDLRAQGRRRRTGSASTARPTNSACAPTPRCSTATSRSPSTASTT